MPDYTACDLAKYGFDLTVATTQAGLNSALLSFLNTHIEPNCVYYWLDTEAGVIGITHEELLDKTGMKDLDVFSIKNGATTETDDTLKKLDKVEFYCGFKARLGIPPMSDPTKTPDVINITDSMSQVNFNLLCSQFHIVQLDTGSGRHPTSTWKSYGQERDAPWIYQSLVKLKEETISSDTWKGMDHTDKHSSVGDDVKACADKLVDAGAEFSIESLLLDLTDTHNMTDPVLPESDSEIKTLLDNNFRGRYFKQMQKAGRPLLMVALPQSHGPRSTLTVSSVRKRMYPPVRSDGTSISKPTIEEQRLATLNYLCMTDPHRQLPSEPVAPFRWEWLSAADLADHDGIVAVQGKRFIEFLDSILRPVAKARCLPTNVKMWYDEHNKLKYYWEIWLGHAEDPTPVAIGTNHIGSNVKDDDPSTWPTAIKYVYEHKSDRDAGSLGPFGALAHIYCDIQYRMEVSLWKDRVHIVESSRVPIDARNAFSVTGDVVNRTVRTLYNMATSGSGELQILRNGPPNVHDGEVANCSKFVGNLTGFDDMLHEVQHASDDLSSLLASGVVMSDLRSFIFLGARAFSFKWASFGPVSLDLLAQVTYNV